MTLPLHAVASADPPRTVACLLAPHAPPLRLGRSATIRTFDRRHALVTCVRTERLAAVVLDLRDALGRSTAGTVRAVRDVAPMLPVFARCRPFADDCRLLLEFARAGGSDVLVNDDIDALVAALSAATAPSRSHSLVSRLVAAGVPHALKPLLEALFAHLDDDDAPDRVAATLGVSRRALERRLARAALPPPRVLQSWCRLLVAADRLAGDGAPVERVAHDVGFSSANALRNALQRYGNTTPTTIRAGGGVDTLLARLCAERIEGGKGGEPRRVAERAAGYACRSERGAMLLRRLTAFVAARLSRGVALREACRARCASTITGRPNVASRSPHRAPAASDDRATPTPLEVPMAVPMITRITPARLALLLVLAGSASIGTSLHAQAPIRPKAPTRYVDCDATATGCGGSPYLDGLGGGTNGSGGTGGFGSVGGSDDSDANGAAVCSPTGLGPDCKKVTTTTCVEWTVTSANGTVSGTTGTSTGGSVSAGGTRTCSKQVTVEEIWHMTKKP